MSFPRYPAYKDSGHDWLGSIPSDWGLQKFRHLFRESNEKIESEVFGEMLSVSGYRGIELKEYDDENRRRKDEDLIGYRIVQRGQLVVNTMWLNYAGLGFSDLDGHVSPAYRAYWPRKDESAKYLHYLLRSEFYVKGYTRLLTGVRPNSLQMSRDNMMSFPVVLPGKEEQLAIASFLVQETAKIDALIAEQQRLIELLQEKRQAVISHAVTKGLNPNAPMKASGVEWLGEVLEHWEVGPIKRFLSSMNYKRVPLSSEERASRQGNYPYYGASGIIDAVDDFLFNESLVLVSEDGANLLMRSTPIAFEAHGEYWVNNHVHILRPKDGLTLFWSERIESLQIAPYVTGSAQPKLTAEALLNLTVSCPLDVEEKKAIEERIQATRLELEPFIEVAENAVNLLQERRSALISAAVTGQIDVRGLVPEAAEQ